MDKKPLIKLIVCYIIWGAAALYWNLFGAFDLVFKVACRIVFSALFCLVCLICTKKLYTVKQAFSDKKHIKYIILSSVCITANWLIYVWALSNGHVIDASLGNYMNPIAISVFSIFVFRDKVDALQIASLIIALAGTVISIAAYGSFPYIGLLVMTTFTAYSLFKKMANTDGLTATFIETGLMAPVAIAYVLAFSMGVGGIGSVDSVWTLLLLISTGAFTAVPFILYASGVNNFSALFVGLSSMFTPTVTLLIGLLFLGEKLTPASAANLICVLIAMCLFVVSMIRRERAARSLKKQEAG